MVTEDPLKANLRVGLLLEVLDKLAERTALRYARRTHKTAYVVTAAIDDLKVCAPPDLERDIVLNARINFVGTTSMEVGIRIEHPGEVPVHLGSCYFTMAARVGDKGATLPPLHYKSKVDLFRAERAISRRKERSNRSTPAPPTPEEWNHLVALHDMRSQTSHEVLPASSLVVSSWERTYPDQENVPQTIFGGYIIHRAYMYAHLCAEMVATQRALLVSANRINFYEPVRMGDKLHFQSYVTYTGETSVCVETEIIRISRDRTRTALSNNCIFTFVNVDKDLNLVAVPPVIPMNFSEDIRYLEGYRRQRAYKASRLRHQAASKDEVPGS